MNCEWKLRTSPASPELICDRERHIEDRTISELPGGQFTVETIGDPRHHAVLRDYAYPGSETGVDWKAGDRREYIGDWPGICQRSPDCNLHAGHHGRCVA